MDLLRAEIANKRKFIEQNNLIDERKKFFKREELNKKIEDEYWAKQNDHYEKKSREKNNFDQSDIKNSNSKDESFYGKTPEEIATIKLKKIIENPSNERSSNETESDERILPRKEVVKRLRERNQPILLFGESESDAFRRLRKLEILEPDSTEKGFRNDFQEAMEKVDAAYLEEIVKSGGSFDSNSDKKRGKNDVKIEEMNTSIDEIIQEAKYLGRQRSNHKVRLDEARRKSDCSIISKFLKYLLELWGRKLNDRNESEKRSTQGRLLTAIYTQTQDYLKPMFKQLTKETIAEDILKHLILIVKHLLERDYNLIDVPEVS
ncbi:hypothetical protein NH340_JMT04578 [Sarcoptes scabiei]|nr:hypothetical protein NH340_JMT04578 [Sarcoptes scabiei]